MARVVMKFGGTSVADINRLNRVAVRLIERAQAGDDVVAVVSAMGKVTDDLIGLAHQANPKPCKREMDMLLSTGEQVSIALLAMAIQSQGYEAVSFTGAQVGIITDSVYSKAKIVRIDAACVLEALIQKKIVIVAGFQGRTTDGQITTLGRGGSDTTAVALAAGIKADACEIYSDVDGVYSADPRIVPNAHKLDNISYEEMLEMAASGAGVLSMRSVEFARNFDVIIHCRHAFKSAEEQGTIVKGEDPSMEDAVVSAVTHDTGEAKITIRGVPDRPGIAASVFDTLSQNNVNVDMIIQNISDAGLTDISFTAPEDDINSVTSALEVCLKEIGARTWNIDRDIAKVSIIGAGMKSHPGITAKMFKALAEEGINLDLISTSPIRVSCIIAADQAETAVRALHTAFGLDQE
ncbi:MAG: aspartate kinase [Coriobacteriia bacterium]|nr:aspartate kinase [Coriobacteriia bacterium]